MGATDGLRQPVGHHCPGADEHLDPPGVDHFAEHPAHLGHGHGPGDCDHAGAVGIVGHGAEDLECLAQLAAAEGGVRHLLQQVGQAFAAADIQRLERLEAIVTAVVEGSGHGRSSVSGLIHSHFRTSAVGCQGDKVSPNVLPILTTPCFQGKILWSRFRFGTVCRGGAERAPR